MNPYTYHEVRRRILDLAGLSVKRVRRISRWFLRNLNQEIDLPFSTRTLPGKVMIFEANLDLEDAGELTWLLKVSISGEGLLRIDGSVVHGVEANRGLAVVKSGRHSITLEAYATGSQGGSPWIFSFNNSLLIGANWKGLSLAIGMIEALRLAESIGDPLKNDILAALSKALQHVDVVPSILQVTGAQAIFEGLEVLGARWDREYTSNVYGIPVLMGVYRDIEDQEASRADEVIDTASKVFEEELKTLREKYPKIGEVIVFGHAHIDAAWLWPYSETLMKLRKTFANTLMIHENGWNIPFLQSSAQYYAWIEEIDRDLYSRILREIERGLWIPVGGMWVEPDTNLVSGESLARQLLYGQLYFKEKFSRIARIGWLPDSFGFSAQLPQLLRKAGLEVFVTHKLMWNDTNKFPHTLFIWEGLDGSRIPVHILPVSYSGVAHAGEFTEAWRKHVEKEGPALHAVGLGDGGGGLNPFIAERLKWMKDLPLTPNVEYEVSEEEYLERIKRIESKLPVWRGELYVEIHRGVYTMNHRIKELVSRLERCLRVAETWASIAWIEGFSEYPSDTLSRAWRVLLRNQFHDVLSGTASWEAYREAFEELEKTLEECNSILEKTMEAIAGSRDGNGRYIYIFNSLPWSRREVVSLPRGRYESRGTVILGSQDLGDSVALELEIPGLGYIVLEQASKEPQQSSGPATALARGDDIVLSNGVVEVTLHADGSITLVDNELGWHAIGKESFVFKAHQDKPGLWDAWDIEKSTLEDPGVPLKPLSKPRILLNGPLIACAEIPLGFKSSQVLEIVCLKGSLKIVEISLGVAWKSRGYLLKLWVKPSLSFKYVDCEIPFGVLKRPAEPRDDFERAKYEFPVLRWIDASDGLKGLALLSPTLHGYSVKDGWIGLTIAKSPLFPDPYSGLEPFEARVGLYTHRGDYLAGDVYRKAYEFWDKPEIVSTGRQPSTPSREFISIRSGHVVLEALKRAEDGRGVIARVYSVSSERNQAIISLWKNFTATEVNILEEAVGNHEIKAHGSVQLELQPFEVKTLKLELDRQAS